MMNPAFYEEGLIRPMKRKGDPRLGPDALFIIIPADLQYLLSIHDPSQWVHYHQGFFSIYQIKKEKACPLTIAGPFLGAPQTVMGMEKIIALGAKRIWVLGWCGSLQPDLKIGDFLIPLGAVSEEGTSRHYPIGGKRLRTDGDLNTALEHALQEEGLSCKKGLVWTTDAPYREIPSKVKSYQEKGVMAVEMEMSAMMRLAIFRSIRLTALLTVSDELFTLKWHAGFSRIEFKKRAQLAGRILLGLSASFDQGIF